MTALEIKKELIKKIVVPFFKRNNFQKKGVRFYRDLSFFQIEVDIQSQRYYKEENEENFRINYLILCGRFSLLFGGKGVFGGGAIQQENSWITITNKTDINKLSNWLENELENIVKLIDIFSDINKVIAYRGQQDVEYAFLLKELAKSKELSEWIISHKKEKEAYFCQLKEIEKENQELLASPDSLDKSIRLDGIRMRLDNLNSKIREIDREIKLIER
ncbi:hypothetical protein [Bacteroides sp. 224]|uniref:hypothetical protein n=1 Tax=Bacteroides sp. 224 TaxID=2302936 RepID=UPI0013D773B8|nr:hypothetical protein [Bacteroides sp. 224]NDV64887.1 hypothetical protein [Bacteroides sp. 224]